MTLDEWECRARRGGSSVLCYHGLVHQTCALRLRWNLPGLALRPCWKVQLWWPSRARSLKLSFRRVLETPCVLIWCIPFFFNKDDWNKTLTWGSRSCVDFARTLKTFCEWEGVFRSLKTLKPKPQTLNSKIFVVSAKTNKRHHHQDDPACVERLHALANT